MPDLPDSPLNIVLQLQERPDELCTKAAKLIEAQQSLIEHLKQRVLELTAAHQP